MTIRYMLGKMWLLIVAALLLVSCGDAERPAPAVPAALTDQISSLQERIDVLEADAARTGAQADKVADRLWGALARLRKEMKDTSGSSTEAAEAAQQALAEVRAAAGDLAVLTSRYDYHLRRYHGGG